MIEYTGEHMRMMKRACIALSIMVALMCIGQTGRAFTLETVKERGELNCGVSIGSGGFSNPDDTGNWHGLNVDVCRAVAAATIGDAQKVRYVPLTARNRLTSLQSGEVDLLSMNISWTMTIDTSLALHFVGAAFFDGQSFLASTKLNVGSALELKGATVCVLEGSDEERNLVGYFKEHAIDHKRVGVTDIAEMSEGLESGRCNVMTGRRSELYGQILKFKQPVNYIVLPELISREPMGPVVRQGDDNWFNIVRWSLFTLINGEAYGATSNNVDELLKSPDPDIRKLLGLAGIRGKGMGLSNDWGYQIIKQVGNYGQSFERNLGQGSLLKMDRGLNRLWNSGGIHYAPPNH